MIFNGIDYGDLIFSKRHELDKLAYSKYYNNFFDQIIYDTDDGLVIEIVEEDAPLTFNEWYGTELHERYVNIVLRKRKIEKIINSK